MNPIYSVGIDIGGTNTDIGIVNEAGQCIDRCNLSTPAYGDNAELYMDDLVKAINGLLEKHGIKEIKGVGIGAPNGNYFNGTIDNAPNLKFKGEVKLRDTLHAKMGVKVVVTNDANAAAYGEKIYGGGKNMNDFIMFTLGTGVGSGIIVDGKLVYGHDGFAGELGHAIVFPGGRLCSCGRKGCLEEYASARGIVQTCRELMAEDKSYNGPLAQLPADKLDSRAIGEAANNGDPIALKVFAYTGYVLGIAISNAVTFSSPEAIFLIGGPTKAGDVLFEPMRKSFSEHVLPIFEKKGKIPILLSQLNANDVAIVGAAALVNE